MGIITVNVSGSFVIGHYERKDLTKYHMSFDGDDMDAGQPSMKKFSASHGGHALAVAETIRWLSQYVLPWAIQRDHFLQADGDVPNKGFGNPQNMKE